jgi:sugar lactone lactonase YvrE
MRSKLLAAPVVAVLIGCGGSSGSGDPQVLVKSISVAAGDSTPGAVDGPLNSATFNNPVNAGVDSDGTVYVCDFDNNLIRVIRDGTVSTLVAATNFQRPFGITIDGSGNLYAQTDGNDLGEHDATTGTVWRVDKGTGSATVIARNLGRPRGLAATPDGKLVMANLSRNTIEMLDPATGAVTPIAGENGTAGFADGTGTAARFNRPYGLTRETDGSFLVADQGNHCIRRVRLNGEVTTYAGTGTSGYVNGSLTTAQFNGPQDIKRAGNRLFVADTGGKRIREISGGAVKDFAGDGNAGFADGTGVSARFFGLESLAVSPNGKYLYAADGSGGEDEPYHRVRFFKL